jgi:hypothetical protein
MAPGLCIVALLTPLTSSMTAPTDAAGVCASQEGIAYRLDAKPKDLSGYGLDFETVYTFYQSTKGSEREIWRITLNEKFYKHFIDGDGNVWVLSDSPRRVRPGTFTSARATPSKLWVRDKNAREIGDLPLGSVLATMPADLQPGPQFIELESVRVEHCTQSNTRMVIPYESGIKLHVYRLYDSEEGHRWIATWAEKGKVNPLEAIIEADSPHRSWFPIADRRNIEYWEGSPGSQSGVLIVLRHWSNTTPMPIPIVMSIIKQPKADYVRVTPNNSVLWFSFDGNKATLDVFNGRMGLIGRVDFIANGMFESAYDAERLLDFTRLETRQGRAWINMERADQSSLDQPEVVGFGDSENRFYRLTIPPYNERNGEVAIVREHVHAKHLDKEPNYIDYDLIDERKWNSKNGVFAYRVRRLRSAAGKTVTRQTFLRVEPNGEIHEYWSNSVYGEVLDAFVTDTGRSLVLTTGEVSNLTTNTKDPYALLDIRDYRGQLYRTNIANQHFFGSVELARTVDLSGLTVTYEGDIQKFVFEGDDLSMHSVENYEWKTAMGKTIRFAIEATTPRSVLMLTFPKQP